MSLDSPIHTVDSAGRVNTTSYTRAGGVLSVTRVEDPAGLALTTVSTYDPRGLPRSTTDGNGDTTTYAHDGLGRQTSYANARGHTFSFQYDAAGRRTRRTEPDTTYQTYTYDAEGNLTQHRKADGTILTTTYTSLNLPDYQSSTVSAEWTDWAYDSLGRLVTHENQDVTLLYAYGNGSNRIVTETTVVKGLSNLTRTTTLGYDTHARHNTFTRSGVFHLAYTHDAAGRIATVTNDSPPPLAVLSYQANGLLNTIAHENGLTTTYGHDAGGQALTVHTRNPGNTLLSGITHTLDAAGRRISATYEDNLGQAYAYDAASQLTHGRVGISNASQANAKQSSTHAYSYDSAGNRQSSLAFGQTSSYTTNSVNAYTSISGGGFQAPSPSYDANGNTLSLPRPDGTSQALAWDTHNRLRSVYASSTQMTYDPRGRLVWIRNTNGTNPATDEIWSWSSWTLLAREVLQAGTPVDTFRYTWGPDLSGTLEGAGGVGGLLAIEHAAGYSTTWDIRHVHSDANGNVLALTNDAGQISARYRYSPFGELVVSQNVDNSGWHQRNIHRFSTKPEVAGTGLLYYGYRWYDPATGRWPSKDPIEERGGINLYGFVGNDGANQVDVLGNIPALGAAALLALAQTAFGVALDLCPEASTYKACSRCVSTFKLAGGATISAAGMVILAGCGTGPWAPLCIASVFYTIPLAIAEWNKKAEDVRKKCPTEPCLG